MTQTLAVINDLTSRCGIHGFKNIIRDANQMAHTFARKVNKENASKLNKENDAKYVENLLNI